MKDPRFNKDDFSDILGRDGRYSAQAYGLMMVAVDAALHDSVDGQMDPYVLMDEFKFFAQDRFGPLAHRVLIEWGVSSNADIGNMLHNLIATKRVAAQQDETQDAYKSNADFAHFLLNPYEPKSCGGR